MFALVDDDPAPRELLEERLRGEARFGRDDARTRRLAARELLRSDRRRNPGHPRRRRALPLGAGRVARRVLAPYSRAAAPADDVDAQQKRPLAVAAEVRGVLEEVRAQHRLRRA